MRYLKIYKDHCSLSPTPRYLLDSTLSLEAKGVASFLFDLEPEGEKFEIDELIDYCTSFCSDASVAIVWALGELRDRGYIRLLERTADSEVFALYQNNERKK